MIIERINEPKDLRNCTMDELNILAQEMRDVIIKKVNAIGGHMGSNLGIVEATIAMHYVFNSPVDKIVFDVSHQCYPHKIITGRKDGFCDPDKYYKYTGFTAPEESEHDIFKIGHTSTSVSLAVGLAKSRDLQGGNENIIALIGDGSLSGGEAYEGLNNAADLDSNIIILVNDNDMSIAENHGGLYRNLKLLRDTKGDAECNFFKSLGFDYRYFDEGNNIEKMIELFKSVKDINHPIVVHFRTTKGLGLPVAEKNKEVFHFVPPGVLDENKQAQTNTENYNTITTDFILKKVKEDKTVIAISVATPGAYGFTQDYREKLGCQYTDVGIAEEHAVAYASALAKSGSKPILSLVSTFAQRTYDQLSQDLCLNNSPITMLIYWGGLSSLDSTHTGCFDIPLISNIPNIVYLAPTSKEEYLAMFEWSLAQTDYPVAIRVPSGKLVSTGVEDNTNYYELNKFSMVEEGKDIAIIGLGSFYHLACDVKDEIKSKLDINATLINPKFITGLDEEMLNGLKSNHKLVITLEDGILDGGFGEKIARFYGGSEMKVLNFGGRKEFTEGVSMDELHKRYHLTKELIVEDAAKCLGYLLNV